MLPLNNTDSQSNITNLKKPIRKLAYLLAKITLKFNLQVHEFIQLYKFQIVTLARQQNTNHSIVELSARTGLDRRYVSNVIKNEELKRTRSKMQLIINQIKQTCMKRRSKKINKRGMIGSFVSICQQATPGTLTHTAIATELIRQGEIIDKGKWYEVVSLENSISKNSVISFTTIKKILYEIREICDKNNTQFIAKFGTTDSFSSICSKISSDPLTIEAIINELIQLGNIRDNGNSYELTNWEFTTNSDESYLDFLITEIDRTTDTTIENILNPIKETRKFQRNVYSSQINPKKFKRLHKEINDLLFDTHRKIYQILMSHEDDVPRNTYPVFGASMFTFGPDHNLTYCEKI